MSTLSLLISNTKAQEFLEETRDALEEVEEFFEETGFGLEDAYDFNVINFFQKEYYGECPGKSQIHPVLGWFKEKNTEPKNNRRVRIYNKSIGKFNNITPYTDRDYNNAGGTERIDFQLGNKHSNRYFIVREGTNEFEYVIYDGSFEKADIVKKGSFSAKVNVEIDQAERNIDWKEHFYCFNPVTGSTSEPENSKCEHLKLQGYILMAELRGQCEGKTVVKNRRRGREW